MSQFATIATPPLVVEQATTPISTRQNLNFAYGAEIADNPSNASADVTILGSNQVATGTTLTVGVNDQLIVCDNYYIFGTLILEGTMKII